MKPTSTKNGKKAGRPKQPITKNRLLAIASGCFAENGYTGTSLNTIAEEAGIHRASLLHHFPSKLALYTCVLDQVVGDLQTFIADSRQANHDFVKNLDELGSRIVTYLGKNPGVGRLLMRELVDGGPYFKGSGEKTIMDTLHVTEAFLKAGMDAGTFTRQDPKQLALSIIGIHLYPFAALPSNARFIGKRAFSGKGLEKRREIVLDHVRRLCLLEENK